jgi:hypothetical protein
MLISYEEYLSKMHLKDNKDNWIYWKMDICGMSEEEAIKVAYNPEWGYKTQ